MLSIHAAVQIRFKLKDVYFQVEYVDHSSAMFQNLKAEVEREVRRSSSIIIILVSVP